MSDEAKLKQYLVKYRSPDVTKREVLNVIQHYKGLSFNFESFIFNDGTCMELVNLEGTIPVVFKGGVYNIPVCIWLMDTHPANAPLCYVKPTAEMAIKVSKCVDYSGKVYLRYLHEWKAGNSNVLKLIKSMCATFGETPPVYTKPREEMVQPSSYYPGSFMPQPGGSNPGGYLPYPSMPPYPMPGPPATNLPYPSYSIPSFPGQQPNFQSDNPKQIDEYTRASSLRSAVEDRLKHHLREHFSQTQAELETLRRTQKELSDGKTKLVEILSRLDREGNDLEKNVTILEEIEVELVKSISKLSDQDGVDPDEAVMTTAPLYNQLLNAFAEEATTEDAIYYLGESLRTGVIDLDSFLKQVRALSRKQFSLRALMQKCRQKAGLAY